MEDCLLGYTLEELTAYLQTLGEKPFRAKQLYGWLHKGAEFDEMRTLPAALRERLKQSETAIGVSIIKTLVSQKDGTEKYLFSLHDGNVVEGVLMRYNYGNTLCISSQVGCRMGCSFCASTLEGRVRDMTEHLLYGQEPPARTGRQARRDQHRDDGQRRASGQLRQRGALPAAGLRARGHQHQPAQRVGVHLRPS